MNNTIRKKIITTIFISIFFLIPFVSKVEEINAFIAAFSIYALPILLSRTIDNFIYLFKYMSKTGYLKTRRNRELEPRKNIKAYVLLLRYWLLGTLGVFFSICFFRYTHLIVTDYVSFIRNLFELTIVLFPFIEILAFLLKEKNKISVNKEFFKKENIKWIFLWIGFLSFIFFLLYTNRPFPLTTNFDIFEHQTAINLISQGHFEILPSRLSDTFTVTSYTTLYHVIGSIPVIVYNVNFLNLQWFLDAIHYALTLIAVFYLAKSLFNSNRFACLSVIVMSLTFDSFISHTSMFFMPQTLCAFVCILMFTDILTNYRIKYNRRIILVYIAYLILQHFLIGTIGSLLLLGTLGYQLFIKDRLTREHLNLIIIGEIILFIISILLFDKYSLDFVNSSESLALNLTVIDKYNLFFSWYGYAFILLSILGILFLLLKDHKKHKLYVIITLGLFLLLFLHLAYSLKFFVLGKYFISVVIAYGIYKMITFVRSKWIIYLGTFLIGVAFAILFYFNVSTFQLWNQETIISKNELAATQWLAKNYKPQNDLMILSDPHTQYFMESQSGINSQGGYWASDETRKIIIDTFKQKDTLLLKSKLFALKDDLTKESPNKILLVVGGRYFAWNAQSDQDRLDHSKNIWIPQETTWSDWTYINYLQGQKDSGIQMVYSNNEITIFEIVK